MAKLDINQEILTANNLAAQKNRLTLKEEGILALNMISSSGSGKTSIIEHSIRKLKDRAKIGVIVSDQPSKIDWERISKFQIPVNQAVKCADCHLDAHSINKAIQQFDLKNLDLLFIENVGNLACPTYFDLGEHYRIVTLSITEGDDKPDKYPSAFLSSDVLIINKIDLLEYTNFSLSKAIKRALSINPDLSIFQLSCSFESGLDEWCTWLIERIEDTRLKLK
jgi:hydrogenase nickel incorporation protein HypB